MQEQDKLKAQEGYWQERIDAKAYLLCLLQRSWYLLLLGVAGAVIGSGLSLFMALLAAREPVYQAETKYYIDFADGRLEAKDYYNDYTWNDVMATDLILGYTMEQLGTQYPYTAEQVQDTITADILSDVRYLTITVRTDSEELAQQISAVTAQSLEQFGERMEEFDAITKIKDTGVLKEKQVFFSRRAAGLGAFLGLCLGFFWFSLCYAAGGAFYTKTDVMKNIGVQALGYTFSERSRQRKGSKHTERILAWQEAELLQNLEAITEAGETDQREWIVMDVTEAGYAQSLHERLQKQCGGQSFQVQTFPTEDNGCYKRMQTAAGVILVIPFGIACRERITDVIYQLSMRHITVAGAVIVQADAKWISCYYGKEQKV